VYSVYGGVLSKSCKTTLAVIGEFRGLGVRVTFGEEHKIERLAVGPFVRRV